MELNLFLLILLLSHLSSTLISSSMDPLCKEHDQFALLQFKNSFSLDHTNCPNPNPCLFSWVLHNENNITAGCCSWEGVTCEVSFGHVTGLDLSYCCLHGPFNASNSIFQLTHLQQINLAGNDFALSQIPFAFGKFSMLNSLNLSRASFSGSIPQGILELSSLTSLDLSGNPFLKLPKHGLASIALNMEALTELSLSQVDISSAVPAVFANLTSLRLLELDNCGLRDHFPDQIFLLPKLESISLLNNSNLYGHLPEFPIEMASLRSLRLSMTNFHSELPRSIGNLISLQKLAASYCNFFGQIPSTIGNLTRLKVLGLDHNNLEGHIPSSIFNLKNLEILLFNDNKLSGTVDISMFHEQKNINTLDLSFSHLSVVSIKFANFSLPNLECLSLVYCNLQEFPLFLKKQEKLIFLALAGNNISGEIPAWFLNVSTKTMTDLEISQNFLTRFEQPVVILPWSKLQSFDLSYNQIHGSLPLPPPSISFYILSNNFMGGELSSTICKAFSLSVLDVSNNELSDAIPECLGNLGSSLQILNLAGNKFEGEIPQIQTDNCSLRWINLSQNQLKGKLPRSLANCKDLESLDVGNNHITDTFPSWLGTLPNLQVLILKINNFHGPIGSPSSMADFLVLRIIDLSSNALTGALPSEYFPLWKAMKTTTKTNLTYVQVTRTWISTHMNWIKYYRMSTNIRDKGMDMEYGQVSNMMVFLSLSGNKFVGEIPKSVGILVGLNGLDLSNNNLTGSIPSALGELKQLESLDLSLNKLSGEIPRQLSQLTFLEYLNVSYNNLSGTIPEGGQLDSFGNNSFEGNPGLSRLPLSNRHGSASEPSTAHESHGPGTSDHTKLVLGFEGFATGLAIGLGIGYIITTRNHQWFVKTCLKLRHRQQ